MTRREIHRTPDFDASVQQLSKKDRQVSKIVDKALEEIATSEQPLGQRIPGGHDAIAIYKKRYPFAGRGASHGLRLVYYLAENLVAPLFLYTHAERDSVYPAEILSALKAAGLLPDEEKPC